MVVTASVSMLLLLANEVSTDQVIQINTKLGVIKGIQNCLQFDKTSYCYNEFRQIPYAMPPTGNLRFRKPMKLDKWNDILDATSFGPSCMQTIDPFLTKWLPNTNVSEDCLHLNIYVPTSKTTNQKKSVMIWVHGGGYQTGSGMLTNTSHLAAVGDVIVVTINYRLEAFGFFSTGNLYAKGNYGLWDQKMAIEWVHDNIQDFGGNSSSITIFGQSAGGLSIGIQSLNPNNKGLFQRAIFHSGVANSAFAYKRNPRVEAEELSQLLKCSSQLDSNTVNCMRGKSAEEIHKACAKISKAHYKTPNVHIGIPFAPVIDDDFLPDDPVNLLRRKGPALNFYQSLDVIVGNDADEGSSLLLILFNRNDTNINVTQGIPSSFLCNHIIPTIPIDYFDNNTNIGPLICEKYTSKESLVEQSLQSLDFYGDLFFYSPSVFTLNVHSQVTSSSRFHYLNKRRAIDNSLAIPWYHGTSHADELFYLFPSLLSNVTDEDIEYGKTLIKYWSNFAKTGDVNGPNLSNWPEYDSRTKKHALLDLDIELKDKLFSKRVDFWLKKIYPMVYEYAKNVNESVTMTLSLELLLIGILYKLFGL